MGKLIDMTGQRFGRLTVIERAPAPEYYEQRYAWWRCKCDCGKEHLAVGPSLRNGYVRSCGCLRSDTSRQSYVDITGQRFGRLVAIKKVPTPAGYENEVPKKAWWLCKCDCGREKLVRSGCLREGKTKSCGCYQAYKAKGRNTCK